MPNVIVRPIASPAIDLNAPPGSTAVAKTTQTRKNVSRASIARPAPTPIVSFTTGTPWSRLTSPGKSARNASAARTAPPNCASQ